MVIITHPFVIKNIVQGGTDGNTTDFLAFFFSECYPKHVWVLRSIVQQATDSWLLQSSDTVSLPSQFPAVLFQLWPKPYIHSNLHIADQTSQKETTIWIIEIPFQTDLDSRSLHYSLPWALPKPSKNMAFN